MSLALHFPVNLRIATELLGSDSILFPCTVSGVHHISPHFWQGFADMPTAELAGFLQDLAAKVNLKRFLKAPRQKKKNKKLPLKYDPKHPHVSTAKLLSGG